MKELMDEKVRDDGWMENKERIQDRWTRTEYV